MVKPITTIKVPEQDIQYVTEELKTTPEGKEIAWSGGTKQTGYIFYIDTKDMDRFKAMFPDVQYIIIGM